MKKYHLADALTALELIMAATLTGMILSQTSANYALWVFVIGELCDAFDGICARRWPYPNDNKQRWWRIPRVVQFLEHFSDIWLLCACAVYLAQAAPYPFDYIVPGLGCCIAMTCAIYEVLFRVDPLYTDNDPLRECTILNRRRLYLAGIAIGTVTLIFSTSWSLLVQGTLVALGVIIGIILAKKKSDRLHSV